MWLAPRLPSLGGISAELDILNLGVKSQRHISAEFTRPLLIDAHEYLAAAMRYIHLNAVEPPVLS